MENTEWKSSIIEINHLTKKYGDSVVLYDIDLSFAAGEIHGLIGRNGSGKTMLLKCICGFVLPTKGEVLIRGKKVGRDGDIPEKVGIIIENPGFLPNYSGYKNLKMLAMINGLIGEDKIKASMKRVGLDPENHKPVGKYSLGMRQRLGIAQAIMEDPDILLLDEPMNGLDNQGVTEMRTLFLELKDEGKTILLASHGKEDIEVLCDTVCEMDHGKIIAQSKDPEF